MTEHRPTTLLTGSTGFLGQYVLRELLLRGRRVVALLRAPLAESRLRLTRALGEVEFDIDAFLTDGSLILCEGSLPDDLPECEWGPTDDVVACAASLQLFSNGNGEPWRTNVDGTAELVNWASRHHVQRIHAVSTAYVCGGHNHEIREVFHERPDWFQTEYEETKWLAERRLAEWAEGNGNVVTILRPSFIIGDSQTGYATQFGGFYQFGRMLEILKSEYADGSNGDGTYIPLRMPVRPEDPIQNLVPVDYAARMIAEIALNPEHHGKIYHLTDPQPPSWQEFKLVLEEYFNIYGGTFVDREDFSDQMTQAESLMWEQYELMMPRVRHQPCFDDSNARRIRESIGLEFPRSTRERVFRLLDFAVAKRWGQRSNGRGAKATRRPRGERSVSTADLSADGQRSGSD